VFLGAAHYQLNELAEAEQSLTPLVSDPVLNASTQVFLQGGFALASTLQASGRPDQAREIADRMEQGMLRIRNPILLQHTRAFRADLALRQGRTAEALRWAEDFDPKPFRLIYRFYAPEITLAKVLIAEGSEESLRRAERYLDRLEAFLVRTHNRLFTIPALALRALLLSRRGDEPGAVERLGRSVALAEPGGAVRVFADLDPEIGGLLNRLPLETEVVRFVGRVRAAFGGEGQPADVGVRRNGAGSLTGREIEILQLLSQRLSNKEIARQIYVAPGTVKRHAENIYKKLGVHGRRDAVSKAVGLGLLLEHR
jgi:LuxR family maltose regulon positive regulatory protein